MLIEIRGLRLDLGGRAVLRHVDLSLEKGQILGCWDTMAPAKARRFPSSPACGRPPAVSCACWALTRPRHPETASPYRRPGRGYRVL